MLSYVREWRCSCEIKVIMFDQPKVLPIQSQMLPCTPIGAIDQFAIPKMENVHADEPMEFFWRIVYVKRFSAENLPFDTPTAKRLS